VNAEAAAARLLAARRTGARLECLLPDCRLETVADAYRVHDILIDRLGLGGWKVGKAVGPADFAYAPLFAGTVFPSAARLPKSAYSPRLVEIELAFRPAAGRLEPFLLIEIVSSRFTDFLAVTPLELLADSSASGALLIGDALGIPAAPDSAPILIDVQIDGHRPISFPLEIGEPLGRAAWLANELQLQGRPLVDGQFITTGAQIAPGLAMTSGTARSMTDAKVEVYFD
jgi:2-keto-4-pentenoate hydratase